MSVFNTARIIATDAPVNVPYNQGTVLFSGETPPMTSSGGSPVTMTLPMADFVSGAIEIDIDASIERLSSVSQTVAYNLSVGGVVVESATRTISSGSGSYSADRILRFPAKSWMVEGSYSIKGFMAGDVLVEVTPPPQNTGFTATVQYKVLASRRQTVSADEAKGSDPLESASEAAQWRDYVKCTEAVVEGGPVELELVEPGCVNALLRSDPMADYVIGKIMSNTLGDATVNDKEWIIDGVSIPGSILIDLSSEGMLSIYEDLHLMPQEGYPTGFDELHVLARARDYNTLIPPTVRVFRTSGAPLAGAEDLILEAITPGAVIRNLGYFRDHAFIEFVVAGECDHQVDNTPRTLTGYSAFSITHKSKKIGIICVDVERSN